MPTAAKITVGGHTVYGIKAGNNVAYRTGVQLSGTANITKGSSTITFSTAQTLPANTVLLFGGNTKDCVPDSWPNNCNFKAYFTSAAINNATTVTLTAAYSGSSSTNSTVWNHTTKGIATGDQAEAMYSVVDGKSYWPVVLLRLRQRGVRRHRRRQRHDGGHLLRRRHPVRAIRRR